MGAIIDNIRTLWSFLLFPWALVLIFTIWKPQRYFNSVLLMIACFCTLFFVGAMFGDYAGYAMLACFLLVMLAIFVVPVILIINGLQVIRKESFSIPHLLSLILGIGIAIGEIATVIYAFGVVDYERFGTVHTFVLWLSMTVFYFSCLVLNFVVYSVFIQLLPHVMKFDYVIIHGCGLADGSRMTKLLSNRVDKAIEIYRKCKQKPMLIPSGGRGGDEKISEAQAMKNYLLEHGIPEEHIILEDASATTMENLENSKQIIMSRPGGKRTALISSNYHIYRCLSYAKKVKLHCVGIGAKVALYFWPTALIREFIAVFVKGKFLFWSLLGYVLFISPVIWVMLQ